MDNKYKFYLVVTKNNETLEDIMECQYVDLIVPEYNSDNTPRYYSGTFRTLNDKSAREKLRRSEVPLNTLLDITRLSKYRDFLLNEICELMQVKDKEKMDGLFTI